MKQFNDSQMGKINNVLEVLEWSSRVQGPPTGSGLANGSEYTACPLCGGINPNHGQEVISQRDLQVGHRPNCVFQEVLWLTGVHSMFNVGDRVIVTMDYELGTDSSHQYLRMLKKGSTGVVVTSNAQTWVAEIKFDNHDRELERVSYTVLEKQGVAPVVITRPRSW